MVYKVYEAVKIPIIGMGGIATAEDVIEMMLAGATAVEIGAANLVDPFVCKDIIERLRNMSPLYEDFLKKNKTYILKTMLFDNSLLLHQL